MTLGARPGLLPRYRCTRGSAVITVLILAAVTAVIAAGFLSRSNQEARLATRSFFHSVALNLAEAGVEEALHAVNSSAVNSANGWALASGSTTDFVKSITSGLDFQQATGAIHIRVDQAASTNPVIIVAGVVSIPKQQAVIKQIRVGGSKRHLWSNSIVAKGTVTFSGNASIESYDSTLGPYNAATNRSDLATVASASTDLDPIVVGSNASIYGYVATTGADPVVGGNGRIYGATTPTGTLVDQSRIRRDFTANLPDATAPTGTAIALAAISSTLTLPRVGDVAGANGRYLYSTTGVGMAGNNTVSIKGPVDLIVTGNVSVSGNGSITIGGTGSTDPSLNLYTSGDINFTGNGMVNLTQDPSKTALWGTTPSGSTQTLSVGGNGEYVGTVYAPNAAITMAGNGGSSGAVIGNTVTISGNGNFRYDTRLGTLTTDMDTSFRVNSWSELTGTPGGGSPFVRDNRAPFASLF